MSRADFEELLDKWVKDAFEKNEPLREQLLSLGEKIEEHLEKLSCIRGLEDIDHPDSVAWRGATERYMRELDKLLPGDDFERRGADIPWSLPNMRAGAADFKRGCDITRGLLQDALNRLQEELDAR